LNIFDFSGGLNSKANERGVSLNQGTVVQNARLNSETGALVKRSPVITAYTSTDTDASTSIHRLYLPDGNKYTIRTLGNDVEVCSDDTGVCSSKFSFATSEKRWTWVTYNNIAYGCDGYNNMLKTDGTKVAYAGSVYTADAGSGAGPDGTYTYKVTFYTASYEVSFDIASYPMTVTDNDINLSMIPFAPNTYEGESVIGRKVYRIANSGSTYKLLTNGTIADNTTTTLVDSDADGALGASLSPTVAATVPKFRFIQLHQNRIFGGNNPTYQSRLYYSEDDTPEYFDPLFYFDIRKNDGDQITFVKTLYGRLVVGKDNTIQYLYTDGADTFSDWSVSDPYSIIGCRAPYSVANGSDGLYYLGNNGIYVFGGQNSTIISDKVEPEIKDISQSNRDDVCASIFRNSYYLAYTSSESGATYNDRVLIYDTLTQSFSIDTINISAFCVFLSGTDDESLISGSSSSSTIYTYDEIVYQLIHKEHADFTGTWDDMRYIPEGVGGDADSPELEISWDCTVDGWLTELQTKNASISTINDIVTYLPEANIDRPDKTGTYTSQYLELNAGAFDTIYWNESLPTDGSDITIALRSGASTSDCLAATWSSEFTNSAGSLVSGVTANTIVQYRISATSDSIAYTPTVYKENGYVVKLLYSKFGSVSESTVPFAWESGINTLFMPGYIKELKLITFEYEGTQGTATITFTNETGETDTFTVDLDEHDGYYREGFSGGSFSAETVKVKIEKNDAYDFKVRRLSAVYDVDVESVNR
jgi:hypothetical protein